MTEEKPNSIPIADLLGEISYVLNSSLNQSKKESDDWWESLTYEQKCHAFSAVVSRIHKAEVIERGTYRYAIYDVFGFDADMYAVGMFNGYMEIHNLIYRGMEIKD